MAQDFALLPRVLNAGIAATVGSGAVFPLDLVKTRLQNQHIDANGKPEYSSIFDCFKKTFRQDGIQGLYRGLAVNLCFVGTEKGLKLVANDWFRYILRKKDRPLSLFKQGLAGAGAGTVQIIVSCPMELVKIQLQDAGRIAANARKRGMEVAIVSARGIATGLIKERGILGFYRGISATACRDIIFSLIYFPLYTFMHCSGPCNIKGEIYMWWYFNCGFFAGAFCAFLSTPFDVVKTRMQAIAKSEGQKQYSGILDCFGKTLRREGIRALFKGGACRVIVIAPMSAIAQLVYYIGVAEFILGYPRQGIVK